MPMRIEDIKQVWLEHAQLIVLRKSVRGANARNLEQASSQLKRDTIFWRELFGSIPEDTSLMPFGMSKQDQLTYLAVRDEIESNLLICT